MASWLIYFKERFPLPVYLLLVGGLCSGGQVLAANGFHTLPFTVSFLGLMMFFALLRLMDEFKDYHKDVVAHPQRPLPRGLLARDQVKRVIDGSAIVMLLFGLMVGFVLNPLAGGLYVFLSLYLWLMFKEFYLGSWLAERPILYAITHQLVLVPMCLFAVAVGASGLVFSSGALAYGFTVMGSFFSYEVCRKLDPQAPKILQTYLSMYGPKGITILLFVLSGIAGSAAWLLQLQAWLWPFEALLLLSLVLVYRAPARFKVVEGVATLSLFFHIWAITFRSVFISLGVLT